MIHDNMAIPLIDHYAHDNGQYYSSHNAAAKHEIFRTIGSRFFRTSEVECNFYISPKFVNSENGRPSIMVIIDSGFSRIYNGRDNGQY